MNSLKTILCILFALTSSIALGMEQDNSKKRKADQISIDPSEVVLSKPQVTEYMRNIYYQGAVIGYFTILDDMVFSITSKDSNSALRNYLTERFRKQLITEGYSIDIDKPLTAATCPSKITPSNLSLGAYRALNADQHCFYQGKVIGQITYTNNPFDGSRSVLTFNMHEPIRNQGFGTICMQHFIAQSKEEKITSLNVESVWQAVPFYRRLGFIIQSEEILPPMRLDLQK
jgi:ribosomal protein S18 acetylase RimI-like enzyme